MRFKRLTAYGWLAFLIVGTHSCSVSSNSNYLKKTFVNNFNSKVNNKVILLGCLVYKEHNSQKIDFKKEDVFLKISGLFTEHSLGSENIDSLVDVFTAENANLNFSTSEATFFLKNFIENYIVVNNFIFAKIETDTDEEEMKSLENKLVSIKEISTIYRNYVDAESKMSSLSSNAGLALSIQITYYLTIQNVTKRNEIVKALL